MDYKKKIDLHLLSKKHIHLKYTFQCCLRKTASTATNTSLLAASHQQTSVSYSCFLEVNVNKTRKITMDFRRNKHAICLVYINNQTAEVEEEYKYLGTKMDTVRKKAHQYMYFYCKLRHFIVNCSFKHCLTVVLLNLYFFFISLVIDTEK